MIRNVAWLQAGRGLGLWSHLRARLGRAHFPGHTCGCWQDCSLWVPSASLVPLYGDLCIGLLTAWQPTRGQEGETVPARQKLVSCNLITEEASIVLPHSPCNKANPSVRLTRSRGTRLGTPGARVIGSRIRSSHHRLIGSPYLQPQTSTPTRRFEGISGSGYVS